MTVGGQFEVDGNGYLVLVNNQAIGVKLESSDKTLATFDEGGPKVVGTNTNDNVSTGIIGELISASLASGSAVSLSSNTTANVTSISLTAGDWDVWGAVFFSASFSGGSLVTLQGGINTTSATIPSLPTDAVNYKGNPSNPGGSFTTSLNGMRTRISLASTTTVYLVTQCTFTPTSSMSAYGIISARRVR